jgi:thioredoxin 1
MSKVVEITDDNFEAEVLSSDLPTEVDFWAPWCSPCKLVIPIYERLSKEYEGRFKFCMLNIDENQRTAMQYQVMSIPMQVFFCNGEKVDEILGAVPEATIRIMVASVLQSLPTDDTGRLRVLFTSWVAGNTKHAEQFQKWVERAKDPEGNPSYHGAFQAVRAMEKANGQLVQALTGLSGGRPA